MQQCREGNVTKKDELIIKLLPEAGKMASKYIKTCPQWRDDLLAAAALGLVRAVNNLERMRGNNHLAFISKYVYGAIKEFFRVNQQVVLTRGDIQRLVNQELPDFELMSLNMERYSKDNSGSLIPFPIEWFRENVGKLETLPNLSTLYLIDFLESWGIVDKESQWLLCKAIVDEIPITRLAKELGIPSMTLTQRFNKIKTRLRRRYEARNNDAGPQL